MVPQYFYTCFVDGEMYQSCGTGSQKENVQVCHVILLDLYVKAGGNLSTSSDIWWVESELHLADDSKLVSPAFSVIWSAFLKVESNGGTTLVSASCPSTRILWLCFQTNFKLQKHHLSETMRPSLAKKRTDTGKKLLASNFI